MKTAIIYKSLRGTARQYAEWAHKAITSDLYASKHPGPATLKDYETVIAFSSTYLGRISIRSFLERNWQTLQDKNVILVVVGILPQNHPDSVSAFLNIPIKIRHGLTYFKLAGALTSKERVSLPKENLIPVIQYFQNLNPQPVIGKELVEHRGPGLVTTYRIVRYAI